MQEFIITGNDAGQRLDRFLGKAAPLLPASLMQKGIRTKNITVNGKRAERGQRLCDGDVVRLYLDDRYFEKPAPDSGWKKVTAPKLQSSSKVLVRIASKFFFCCAAGRGMSVWKTSPTKSS